VTKVIENDFDNDYKQNVSASNRRGYSTHPAEQRANQTSAGCLQKPDETPPGQRNPNLLAVGNELQDRAE